MQKNVCAHRCTLGVVSCCWRMQLTEREGIKKSFRSRSQALKIERSLGPSCKKRRPDLGLGLGLGFGPSFKERRPGLGFGPSFKERRPGGGRSPNSPVPFEIGYGCVFARPWQAVRLVVPLTAAAAPSNVCCRSVCAGLYQPHQSADRRAAPGWVDFNF